MLIYYFFVYFIAHRNESEISSLVLICQLDNGDSVPSESEIAQN